MCPISFQDYKTSSFDNTIFYVMKGLVSSKRVRQAIHLNSQPSNRGLCDLTGT